MHHNSKVLSTYYSISVSAGIVRSLSVPIVVSVFKTLHGRHKQKDLIA